MLLEIEELENVLEELYGPSDRELLGENAFALEDSSWEF